MVELGLYLRGAVQLQVQRLSNLPKLIRDDGKHFGPSHRRTARPRLTCPAASTSLAASTTPSSAPGGAVWRGHTARSLASEVVRWALRTGV